MNTPIAAQYEVLRMAALGEALPPMARSGLMLFLRRGTWGWAQTLAAAGHAQHERTAVVYVLATMAMSTPERRTP
jgi:hypothetical protein